VNFEVLAPKIPKYEHAYVYCTRVVPGQIVNAGALLIEVSYFDSGWLEIKAESYGAITSIHIENSQRISSNQLLVSMREPTDEDRESNKRINFNKEQKLKAAGILGISFYKLSILLVIVMRAGLVGNVL